MGVYPNTVPIQFDDLQTLHKAENISDAIVNGMCKLISNQGECLAYEHCVYDGN